MTDRATRRPIVLLHLLERKDQPYTTRDVAQALDIPTNTVGPILSAAKGQGLVEVLGPADANGRLLRLRNTPKLLGMDADAADRLLGRYQPSGKQSVLRVHLAGRHRALVEAVTRGPVQFTTETLGHRLGWRPSLALVYLRPLIQAGLVVVERLGYYRRAIGWTPEAALRVGPGRGRIKQRNGTGSPRPAEAPPGPSPLLDLDAIAEWRRKAAAYDQLVARLRAAGIDPGPGA